MILVTKQQISAMPTAISERILHIFTAQVRYASLETYAPTDSAPYVLDLNAGQWNKAIQDYAPDSRIISLASESSEDSKGRWLVGDFQDVASTFDGQFDWVLGDDSALSRHNISPYQLIYGGLRLLREGGWLGLYLPLNYIHYSPYIHIRRQISPYQLWIASQSQATNPYALHVWRKGRPFSATRIEWFE
jgi:hypothetical protein